ncbi:hypothetical protein N7478_004867 [Penicillium angulare]|uniref:uncharacterized protein n=1 Tax=Penicillium angulare TaxID=116970 RepID=UPI00253F6659|nr:uncharacterized protein N7478_004867 [Penicillium angulare]KAJ5279495.1 hypothetical protein N7478_004867 [Penicillium angulare]
MLKPSIIIIPGAWHRPKHYEKLNKGLEEFGYESVAVDLPSLDSSPPLTSWEADAQEVRRVIMNHLDHGKNVIMIAHSFGGVAMSEAVKGLGRKARQDQGLQGAVVRLVYMAAVVIPIGQSYMDQMKMKTPEGADVEGRRKEVEGNSRGMIPQEDGSLALDEDVAKDILFHGCDPQDVQQAVELLGSFPSGPMYVPVTYSACVDFPSTYIKCKNDRAFSVLTQERMIAQMGGVFDVEECEEGHSPFLSNPHFVVDCIRRAVGEIPMIF